MHQGQRQNLAILSTFGEMKCLYTKRVLESFSCPVCSESAPLPLSTLTDMPLTTCQFAESRADALRAARGPLELVLCKSCGHIYNRAFEPNRVAYSPGYENALNFSARHRTESEATVECLIRSYALHHKTVVEVGCGTAEFLSLLCAKEAITASVLDNPLSRRLCKVHRARLRRRCRNSSS
jgi:hypothetical protein